VCSGGDSRSGGSISSGDDLLRVQEVDAEEPHGKESDKDERKYDGDVCRDEIVFADLGPADR
jgi:hypothetical protein